jgi:hypothetical protein
MSFPLLERLSKDPQVLAELECLMADAESDEAREAWDAGYSRGWDVGYRDGLDDRDELKQTARERSLAGGVL